MRISDEGKVRRQVCHVMSLEINKNGQHYNFCPYMGRAPDAVGHGLTETFFHAFF